MAPSGRTACMQELPRRVLALLVFGLAPLSQVCVGHLDLRALQRARQDCPCKIPGTRMEAEIEQPDGDPVYYCCDGAVPGTRAGSGGGPKTPKPSAAPGLYFLEHVGLQGSGVLGPQAMESAEPSLCLTAGAKEDLVGGFELSFKQCEASVPKFKKDPNVHNVDPELKRRQQFQLMPNGEIRTMSGQCVRRMACTLGGKGSSFIYDVGRCNGPGYVAKFVVQKPEVNSLERLHMLGYPNQVMQPLPCTSCGPYMLVEVCLTQGESRPSNSQTCGQDYQSKPGFTKMPSTYIGDAAVHGRPPRINSVDTVMDRLSPRDQHNDLTGLAATDWDGVCGSYATDGLTMDSFFVFHRANAEE